ncbi:MAG: hypothetical protein AABX68_00095 [Nanoarchaeota archaeon]
MAKKKRVTAKKTGTTNGGLLRNKISITWKNLLLYILLFVVSLALWRFISSPLLNNLFGLLAIIMGFLVFAFFIVLVVLEVLKPRKA